MTCRGGCRSADYKCWSHVAKTASACYSVLRQLRTIRRSVSKSVLQSLVSSLVLSRLDYGNSTLAGVSSYLLSRLQSVINCVLYGTSVSNLHKLQMANKFESRHPNIHLSTQKPAYLYNVISYHQPSRSLRSSSQSLLQVPRVKTDFGHHAFSSAAPQIWNHIPAAIKVSPSLDSFKRHLETHFYRAIIFSPPSNSLHL